MPGLRAAPAAIPSIGALPAVPNPAAGLPALAASQEWGALGMLPQAIQAGQLNQQAFQTQMATDQEQQAELGQKALERLVVGGINNPAVQANPQYRQMLEHAAKLTGVPVAYTPDGQIDLRAMYPKREMTEQETQLYGGMSSEQRKQALSGRYDLNVMPGFLEMDPILTAGQKTAFENDLQRQLAEVANPLGSGPAGLIAWAQAHAKEAKNMGIDLSRITDNPDFVTAIGRRADVQTQKLVELGIVKPQAETAYREKYLQFQTDKMQREMALKAEDVATRAKREQDEHQRVAGQLARWDAQTANEQRRLDQAESHFNATLDLKKRGLSVDTQILHQANLLKGALGGAQSAYDSLVRVAQGYTSLGQDVPQEITDRLAGLKARIDKLTPAVDAATNFATQQQANMVRTVTGAPNAQPVGGGGGEPATKVNPANGRTYYLHSDGNYYQSPP